MPRFLEPTQKRIRRFHSDEFKSQVILECRHDRSSVAGVALSYQVNANIVHRWLREHEQHGMHSTPSFIPLAMDAPSIPVVVPQPVVANQEHAVIPVPVELSEIRIEVKRGHHTVMINWPTQAAASCAMWLSELLK